jgi:hypothetical protein
LIDFFFITTIFTELKLKLINIYLKKPKILIWLRVYLLS